MYSIDLHIPVLHTSVLRDFFQSLFLMIFYRLRLTVGRHLIEDILPRLYKKEQLRLRESLETTVRRVRVSCEVVAGQYGREHGS
jgi:hypothetical protein